MTLSRLPRLLESRAKDRLRLTSYYLHENNLPKQARDYLLALRMRIAFRMVWISARSFQLGKVYYYLRAAFRYEPAWLLKHWKVVLPISGAMRKYWK